MTPQAIGPDLPQKRELTTAEVAAYLHVSIRFVDAQMSSGKIPHTLVGSHRIVVFDDLERYAQVMHVEQNSALDQLARNAEKLDLDY